MSLSQFPNNKWIALLAWVPLFVFLSIGLARSIDFKFHDFGNYYYGAQVMLDGQFDEQIYNADYCNTLIKDQYSPAYFGAFYPNPPSLAMLYSPLAQVPPRKAKLMLNLGSVLFFLMTVKLLVARWQLSLVPIVLLPIVFSYPIYQCILFGQPYLMMMGLIILGYLSLGPSDQSYRKSIGYLAWPLAILLKVSPVVLLSIPLLERRWRDLLTLAAIIVGGGLLSLIWIDLDTWIYYITDVLSRVSDGILYNAYAVGAESLPVLLRHLFLQDALLNPTPLIASASLFGLVFALSKGLLYTIGIIANGSNGIPTGQKVALWMILLLLLSPNISSYGLIYLIFPYLYLCKLSGKVDIPATVIILLVSLYKQEWVVDFPLIFQFGKLIGVSIFLAYFIYISGLTKYLITRWTALLLAGLTTLFCILGGKWQTGNQGNYAFDKNQKVLLHDYTIDTVNSALLMINHSVEGFDTLAHRINIPPQYKPSPLSAKEQNLFDNKVKSTKGATYQHPIKVGNTLYYITDEGRAPGFYVIKQVNLDSLSVN